MGEALSRLADGSAAALTGVARALSVRRGLILASTFIVIAGLGQLARPLDNMLASWRAQSITRPATNSIAIVEIDARSLRQAGQWPWPREQFARAIANLRAAGARMIAFDVDFSARSTPAADTALQSAFEQAPGSIVLPTFLQRGAEGRNSPLAALSRDAVIASVNIPIDADGQVRRYARGFQYDDHYYATMASILSNTAYGASDQFLIDFGIRPQTIDHLSFSDILENRFDPARIRGRAILVGATALELGDEFATPLRPSMPGVYVHALAYESIVQGRALLRISDGLTEILALALLAALWPWQRPANLPGLLARHALVLFVLLTAPLALQALWPVSADFGLLIFAQLISFGASIRTELVARAKDIVVQREAHLRHIAFHDPETDLPNRRAMLEALNGAIAQDGIAVAVVGVDRFPVVRGAIGYSNANLLIRELAKRIEQQTGERVFHLSTSILGVVLRRSNNGAAPKHRADWLGTVDTNLPVGNQTISVDARVGIATASHASANAEAMLENATIALDCARARGQHSIAFNEVDLPDPRAQLELTSGIPKALQNDEFELAYQFKVDASGGAPCGVEALLRWRHPELGYVPPERFVQVAEETGAIVAITHWVLARAIADQSRWARSGHPLSVSVNVSARALADDGFCRAAISLVADASAPICFEITETAIIEDPATAVAAIAAFKAAGISIAIDDYGSGLSSLAYLKQIAADELKLDKALVVDLTTNARDRLILKSTIDLAHGLGMKVVAEGVEDTATESILRKMGCDHLQGFIVGHPVPANAIFSRLQQDWSPRQAG